MAVISISSDVLALPNLADEKYTRTYIFYHNIANKLKGKQGMSQKSVAFSSPIIGQLVGKRQFVLRKFGIYN